jgi:predicted glycosyltransferase
MTTIVFQPPNRIGVGHISRLSAIALALKKLDPAVKTPFVLEGGGDAFLDALCLPYLCLPSSHAMHRTDAWNHWQTDAKLEMSRKISASILQTLETSLIVFDTIPQPACAFAALEANIPIALCLRAIKDPESYAEMIGWLSPHISMVLIPHTNAAFTPPPIFSCPCFYVGEIVRTPAAVEHAATSDAGRQVLITGGGGGYSETVSFYNRAVRAVAEAMKLDRRISARLVTGPLFSEWHLLELADGVQVMPFEKNMFQAMAAADLIICQGGYNTIAEVGQTGTPALCVPAFRGWDDQFERCRQFAASRANVRSLESEDLPAMTNAILEMAWMPREPKPSGGRIAAVLAAERLLALASQTTARSLVPVESSASRRQDLPC